MKLQPKETEYKGIVICQVLGEKSFFIRDIQRTMVISRTGNTEYKYKLLYSDFFREDRRHEILNHRYSRIYISLSAAKSAIDSYYHIDNKTELNALELGGAKSN